MELAVDCMEWITVYVRGRSGYEAEVVKNLDNAGFKYMRGSSAEKGWSLHWIDNCESLRAYKKAIGSKTIFKYRLKFYTNVDDFIESRHNTKTMVLSK